MPKEIFQPFNNTPETTKIIDPDVAHMRNLMLVTKPEPLIDTLREKYKGVNDGKMVLDALDEFAVFYSDETRRYSTTPAMMFPLRLAQAAPSEKNVSPKVTVIRLLYEISRIPQFQLSNYGEDVATGTKALHRNLDETYAQHLRRVRESDKVHPELALVTTKAKAIIHNAIDPAGLPFDEPRIGDPRIAISSRLHRYTTNISELFGEDKTWLPKVRNGIQMGKTALLTPELDIPYR